MPTANLPGGSPATTSYSSDTDSRYVSTFTAAQGRAMANGSRNIYIQSFQLYIAGRSETTSCRAWFAGSLRGTSTSYGAQATPSLKTLSVNVQTAGGKAFEYGYHSSRATNFRRGSGGGTTRNVKSGYQWGTALSGTYTYAEAPPAPSMLDITEVTQTSMKVRFSSNGDGGSKITGWVLQYSTSSSFPAGARWSVSSSGTSTITGLKADTTYYFRAAGKNVVTDNAGTNGPWSSVMSRKTAAPPATTPPTAPRNPKAVDGSAPGSVVFSWTAPSSSGSSAVTNYNVQYSTDPKFGASYGGTLGNVLSLTINDIGPGQWYFRVRARNSSTSTYSPWSSVVSLNNKLGLIGYSDGEDFVRKPVNVYLGGTWQQKKLKVRKGGVWVTLP